MVAWGRPNYSGPDMWYEFNYNQAGRVTGKRMSIPGDTVTTHDATWTWDDRGRTTAMSIDGNSYSYTYDNMSNLSGMTGPLGFNASATYNWAGQRLTLGAGQQSGGIVSETRTYNNLMQLTRLQNGGLDDEYIYQAGQNNGRIVKLIDHIRNETIDYTYDSLNRLTMAEQESGQWGNAFAYDGWGNMTGETFTPGQAATPTPNFQPGRDPNGNITTNYGAAFDVENRLVSTGTTNPTTYGYDPWGKRVKICCNTDQYGNHNPTYFFYGTDGRRLMTYAPYTNGLRDVYFGGTKIIASGSGVSVDRLGSVRNNANGSIAYHPYGQERTSTPDGLDKFGTYTRDGSLGGFLQDYADQRYYAANVGAFWSADPGGMKTANPGNPTSWNRFLYGNGDPMNLNDHTGKIACFTDDEEDCDPDDTGNDDLGGTPFVTTEFQPCGPTGVLNVAGECDLRIYGSNQGSGGAILGGVSTNTSGLANGSTWGYLVIAAGTAGYGGSLLLEGLAEAPVVVESGTAAANAANAANATQGTIDFVVSEGGEVFPVPDGATGPSPTANGRGFQYTGGNGGNGLADNVSGVRVMDPNASYPGGYVNYGSTQANGGWQSVNPYTGKPIGRVDPLWHIPIQ